MAGIEDEDAVVQQGRLVEMLLALALDQAREHVLRRIAGTAAAFGHQQAQIVGELAHRERGPHDVVELHRHSLRLVGWWQPDRLTAANVHRDLPSLHGDNSFRNEAVAQG